MTIHETKSSTTPDTFIVDGSPLLKLLAAACPDAVAQLADRLDAIRAEIYALRSHLESLDAEVVEIRARQADGDRHKTRGAKPAAMPEKPSPPAGTLIREPKSGYRMRYAPAGVFPMGSSDRALADDDEFPQHSVTVSRPFLMGETPVTWGVWNQAHPTAARKPKIFNIPVTQIDWLSACAFANALSQIEGYTPVYRIDGSVVHWTQNANGFRLPTEAEWEYAARAGCLSAFAGSDSATEVAWTRENSADSLHAVASKAPNPWGIYDMSGNVYEWCWDCYDRYSEQPSIDPIGPTNAVWRVRRGGSFQRDRKSARVTYRGRLSPFGLTPDTGFRLVRWAV